MAFYEKVVGKKRDPRDDWRDDEQTRRPKRDQETKDKGRDGQRRTVRGPQKPGYEHADKRYDNPHRDGYGNRQEGRSFGHNDSERNAPKGRFQHAEKREFEREHTDRRSFDGRRAPEREHIENEQHEAENLLVGRNPIREALKAGRDMEKLLVARGELMGSAREIVAMAREQHIVVQEVDRVRLDAMAPNHQGMIAVVSAYEYRTVEDIFALAAERNEEPFVVVLDGITDPHNLGAIIRSAECAGAHGVIIPTRRAVGLTPSAVKASAGAVEHSPVVRETNLSRTLEYLKKEGCWVFGTAMNGKNYRNADYSGPVVLVIGSEGEGISRLVAEHCDDMVTIPMHGKIDSLNASVAAGILMFAIAEKRGAK